ncbi:MAG: LPS export ABC transporter permease LptG [Pseudomonadales bacterium]
MITQLMRYVGLEVLSAILLASFALVGLLAVFTVLEEVQDFRNQYHFVEALKFVGLSLPRLFYETIPFSVLIGGLVGLGGLAARSELLMMRAAGISVFRILGYAILPALAFALVGTVLGEFLLPSAEREARLGRQQARAQTETIAPEFGVWTRDGEAFLHLDAVRNDQISGLEWFVFNDQQSLLLRRTADRAQYIEEDGNGVWEMTHVIETRFLPEGSQSAYWETKRWATAMTPMSLGSELLVQPERMSVQSLFQKIEVLESQDLNSEAFRLGFWAKVFQPFVALGLLVLAASAVFGPLRETSVGMRIFAGLVVGVLFKFIQDLLAPLCLVYGVSPILAILLPVLVCAGIGGWQLRRVL